MPTTATPRATPVRLLLVLAALALLGCAPEDPPAGAPRASAGPAPLLVIGIDGATWDVIDPLAARGELPNFEGLRARGAWARLICVPPLSSPVAWTTIATGHFARRHNILDFTHPYREGPKRTVDSTLRRVHALWNVASDAGRRVVVVGYMVSHPPEIVHGVVVPGPVIEGRDRATHPPGFAAALGPELAPLGKHERAALLRRFVAFDYDPKLLEDPSHPQHRAARVVSKRVDRRAEYDDRVRRVSLRLLPEGADLFITYLRMVDHASHAAWIHYDASDFDEPPDPGDVELLGDLVPAAYRYMDATLGELLAAAGPEWNVVVVSDHGFGSRTGDYAGRDDAPELLTGNHRPDGIFLAAGPDVRPGGLQGVTNLDVAPTLLALQALPVSDELPGRVVREALREEFTAAHPLERVPGYGPFVHHTASPLLPDPAAEAEALEALEALGYIAPTTEVAASGSEAPATDFWTADVRLRHRALMGEVIFHLLRGDDAALAALAREVGERDPVLLRMLVESAPGYLQHLQDEFEPSLFAGRTFEPYAARAAP